MTKNYSIPADSESLTAIFTHWRTKQLGHYARNSKRGRYLSPQQIAALLLAATSDKDIACGSLWACVLLSGITAGDLRGAEWDLYDADHDVIEIVTQETDTYLTYHLLLPMTELLHKLGNWGRDSRYIFQHDGEMVSYDSLTDSFSRIAQRAGLRRLSTDDLIRSHEYIALAAGLFEQTQRDNEATSTVPAAIHFDDDECLDIPT
jgi:integrase